MKLTIIRIVLYSLCFFAPMAYVVASEGALSDPPAPRKVIPEAGGHGPKYFPNVALRTHEGKEVRFYDDLIKGKSVVINFMYARCEGICPGTTANLRKLQQRLGDRVGRDIHMYSITLRPNEDSPEDLNAYTKAHGIGPGWTFLTGKPDDVEALRRALGFTDPDPKVDADSSSHIGMVLYGNEAKQQWAACPCLTEVDQMAMQIEWMMPEQFEAASEAAAPALPVEHRTAAASREVVP